MLNSFTYSRAFDEASGHLEQNNGDTSRVNFANPRGDYGPSSYDQPIDNMTSIVYDLPYGHGGATELEVERPDECNPRRVAADCHQHDHQRSSFQHHLFEFLEQHNDGALNGSGGSTIGQLFSTDLVNLRPQHIAGSPLKGTNITVLPRAISTA